MVSRSWGWEWGTESGESRMRLQACPFSSHPNYTAVHTTLKKSSGFLSRVIRVTRPFQESQTVHCPTVLPMGVHSQEVVTHPSFLWPSSSLLLLALCLLWGNFLLFLLGEHQVKYPHVVEAGRYHEAWNPQAIVTLPRESVLSDHFSCHCPHSPPHSPLQSHGRAGNDSTKPRTHTPCPFAFPANSCPVPDPPPHTHTQEDFASGRQYLSLRRSWLDWGEYSQRQ